MIFALFHTFCMQYLEFVCRKLVLTWIKNSRHSLGEIGKSKHWQTKIYDYSAAIASLSTEHRKRPEYVIKVIS